MSAFIIIEMTRFCHQIRGDLSQTLVHLFGSLFLQLGQELGLPRLTLIIYPHSLHFQ